MKNKPSYSIIRYSSSRELLPLGKLSNIEKIFMTLKYLYIKNFREQFLLNKKADIEKKRYNKTVTLRKFILNTLSDNKGLTYVIQIDNNFLDILDDVIYDTLELKDYIITPIKLNPNLKKYVSNPHILLEFKFKGGVAFEEMD